MIGYVRHGTYMQLNLRNNAINSELPESVGDMKLLQELRLDVRSTHSQTRARAHTHTPMHTNLFPVPGVG